MNRHHDPNPFDEEEEVVNPFSVICLIFFILGFPILAFFFFRSKLHLWLSIGLFTDFSILSVPFFIFYFWGGGG